MLVLPIIGLVLVVAAAVFEFVMLFLAFGTAALILPAGLLLVAGIQARRRRSAIGFAVASLVAYALLGTIGVLSSVFGFFYPLHIGIMGMIALGVGAGAAVLTTVLCVVLRRSGQTRAPYSPPGAAPPPGAGYPPPQQFPPQHGQPFPPQQQFPPGAHHPHGPMS